MMSSDQLQQDRVALVYMPWGSVKRPSIAMGVLKESAKLAGFAADVHYLNMRFAGRIGLELYEQISTRSAIHPEWFFSTKLFGPDGLRLMANSLEQMRGTPNGRELADKIVELAGDSEETCQQILDLVPDYIESCLNDVDWSQYKVVGFSVTFAQTMASLFLARRIKENHPQVAIVFGGANVDSEMGFELLRAFDWVDYVVHGEAEQSFPQLLANIAQGRRFEHTSGVSLRYGSEVNASFADARPLADINESPLPDYTDYFRELERLHLEKSIRVSLPIESSRGCWWGAKHHCTFCGLNGTTMSFRKKDADRVYQEIMLLSKRYRCLSFNATDNIIDMRYFRDLLPRLAEADIDLSLFYEVKANLNREQIRLLASAGVNSIQPGIESFSTELLQHMRKGVTAIQNIQFLKWCSEFGIDPLWNILYAFPGEQRQHYEDHPRLLRLLFHLRPPAGVFPIIFERFSPYHTSPESFKIQIRPSPEYHMLYPESLMDFNKLAYYFEGRWEDESESPDHYIQPVVEAHKEWLAHWQEKRVIFHYEKGPGFLTIYDNRPWRESGDLKMRKLTLNETQAKIYLFCDENRSFSAIQRMLISELQMPPSEPQTQKLLDQFVDLGLMFREANRYLSLAVRKNPLRRELSPTLSSEQHLERRLLPVMEPVSVSRRLPVLD